MVSNKVLVGRRGGVIRGSGFSKYRERRTHATSGRAREGARERGESVPGYDSRLSPRAKVRRFPYVRTYAYVLVRIFVYARARVYVQDWPVYSMPREKILRDVAITDEPTHTVRQRQTGQHRDRTGPSRSVSGL